MCCNNVVALKNEVDQVPVKEFVKILLMVNIWQIMRWHFKMHRTNGLSIGYGQTSVRVFFVFYDSRCIGYRMQVSCRRGVDG